MKKLILAICLCCNSVNASEVTVSKILDYVNAEDYSVKEVIENRPYGETPPKWLDGYYYGMRAAYKDVRNFILMHQQMEASYE